ncbi:MAG: hypothetical protein ABR535_06280 [Pyrinomonadaceae bacterium]
MKTKMLSIRIGVVITVGAVAAAIFLPTMAHDSGGSGVQASSQYVAENAILAGLPPGALFPFIDSTPNRIVSTHIALTDSTTNCSAGAAPPSNIVVLAGEAGVALVPVMSAATNTGIGSNSQCVFHVTVEPAHDGVPRKITDVVVVNGGTAPLTALNTVTVSAEVRGSPTRTQPPLPSPTFNAAEND